MREQRERPGTYTSNPGVRTRNGSETREADECTIRNQIIEKKDKDQWSSFSRELEDQRLINTKK